MNILTTVILTMILASCGQQPVAELKTASSVVKVAGKVGKAIDEMLIAFKKTPELKGRGVDVDEVSRPLIKEDSDLVIEKIGDTEVVFLKGYSPREQAIRFIEDGNFDDTPWGPGVDIEELEETLDIARGRIFHIKSTMKDITDGAVVKEEVVDYYGKQLDRFINGTTGVKLILKSKDNLSTYVLVQAGDDIPAEVLKILKNNDIMVLQKKVDITESE